MATKAIVPNGDAEGALGKSGKRWNEINAVTVNATTVKAKDAALTGKVTVPTATKGDNSTKAANTAYVKEEIDDKCLKLTGGTLTGAVSCTVTPTNNNHITNKKYVDDKASALTIPITHITEMDSAAAHNAFYRGKDLTSYWNSGDMAEAIAAGTFKDIYPGDFIVKSITINGTTYNNVKWIVGDLDYHLGRGDAETTAHHVLIFPEKVLFNAQMNSTNVTTGGYTQSAMKKTTLPLFLTGVNNAFGSSHVLAHRECCEKSVNNDVAVSGYPGWKGAAYDLNWHDANVELFNEPMVYGAPIWSSSAFTVCNCNQQVAAFRLNHNLLIGRNYSGNGRSWWWLRSVVSDNNFANVAGDGFASNAGASYSGGVRPYFLLR